MASECSMRIAVGMAELGPRLTEARPRAARGGRVAARNRLV